MQRYVRLFGTPITLLVLLAILIFGARWGYRNVVAPAPPPPLVPCTQQSVGKALKTSQVTVNVYNGGNTAGLATTVANQLRLAGFDVAKTGNSATKVKTTEVVGAAADNPEVKLVAGYFKGAKIVADNRVDHSVEVRLPTKNTGYTKDAPRSIAVTTPTVCLPSPSAIASPNA